MHRIATTNGPGGVVGEAVVFEHGGQLHTVRAKKEVLVSAG